VTAGKLGVKHIYEIALMKQKDANFANVSLEALCKMLIGSCKSIGIKVEGSNWKPYEKKEEAKEASE
jgi:large subunit ribosomal protein L11